MPDDTQDRPESPCKRIATDPPGDHPRDEMGLCLSGGGYRAMLFHLGTLWRLNELGYLKKLDRISSVSGGSITAAVLGMNWDQLRFNEDGVAAAFGDLVVEPIRRLAGKTLDRGAVIGGALIPGVSISNKLVKAYKKHLFADLTLQDLPDDTPRFVINATNLQSGALWRFMKPYMRDWRVGEIKSPEVPLAVAVAASSAFPPILSPAELEVEPGDFTPASGAELQVEPYTSDVMLADGGIYDNLGLETVWKRCKTVLVSDAGGKMKAQPEPPHEWIRHMARVLDVIDNQVRSRRKCQLLGSYDSGARKGAYWSIRTDIDKYDIGDALRCSQQGIEELAGTKTRLKRLPATRQERLINWGYAVCDAAMRRHLDSSLAAPGDFPYPGCAV